MTGIEALIRLSQDVLWLHALVFFRVAPMIALFPGFGERTVPVRIKLVLALALTAITGPALAPALGPLLAGHPDLARLILTETGIGLLLGIGIRLFVLALQTAGSIAAQSTSLSQILGGASITPMPAIGHLLVTGAVALAMILGLHLRLAEFAIESYRLFPPARLPGAADVAEWGTGRVARAFALAFTLAAPFVIASMLYNLTLGVINRAMPQLMVVFVGAPAITAAGLVLLFLLAPAMLGIWAAGLGGFLADPVGGG
ncbi:flagellar biosynthetic protein FliR [Roseovarius ramblicola]|uniref:Flagellar biosynthetic protein FliR n=1 Tax=Roseovarius ramblicola TaxID=2022336 RepID=A0ABV5HXG1_9RHOB